MNSHKVEFLLVGAHSLALHGHPRYTGDLDLFIARTPENADRIIAALRDLGFGGLDISQADLSRADFVVQLGMPPNRIDLLTAIDGCSFKNAWETKVAAEIDGVPIFSLSREMLITNKRASGRPKDIADADALESE